MNAKMNVLIALLNPCDYSTVSFPVCAYLSSSPPSSFPLTLLSFSCPRAVQFARRSCGDRLRILQTPVHSGNPASSLLSRSLCLDLALLPNFSWVFFAAERPRQPRPEFAAASSPPAKNRRRTAATTPSPTASSTSPRHRAHPGTLHSSPLLP